MSEIEIQIYKVSNFEHYVPKSIDEAFKDEVNKVNKSLQSIGDYKVQSSIHEENCDNPVLENKIFHPQDEVLSEAIEEVLVQVYKVSQSEGDDFIIHCPLDLIEPLTNHIELNNAQPNETDDYSLTIREYRDKCKNGSIPLFD